MLIANPCRSGGCSVWDAISALRLSGIIC